MTSKDYPIAPDEFKAIYSKIPRLSIEVIVRNKAGAVFLTKRAIEPCAGQWHIPGGTVLFGETLLDAVKRVAQRELGISVEQAVQNGYIEYKSHLDHSFDYPIAFVFEVTDYTGEIQINHEAEAGDWFTTVPDDMHADQDVFLKDKAYVS